MMRLRGPPAPAAPEWTLLQTLAKPARESCSNYDENCMGTGCCNVAGYYCYESGPGKGLCLKNCSATHTKSCSLKMVTHRQQPSMPSVPFP